MDLKMLTEINAVVGREQELRRLLSAELKEKGFDPYIDRMGNVIVVKKGNVVTFAVFKAKVCVFRNAEVFFHYNVGDALVLCGFCFNFGI